ncbi:hypothetical protein PAPHI01_0063 [Pancytospora philotis]|nr:hypothetical protein PAPHI01_0063 [Pancytospora philotis]
MLAWLVWRLQVCCASAETLPRLSAPVYRCTDYTDFGDADVAKLSALEVQMLSPLCQYCIKHDNPEIKPAVDDASLDDLAADDKIRMVLHSVLDRHTRDPHFLAQQAGALDYAFLKLLLKLFGDDFIKAFMAGPVQGNLELYLLLAELIDKHQHTVEDIRLILSSAMPHWDALGVTQCIERNRATTKNDLDLMVMLFSVKQRRNYSLPTVFKCIMGTWPNDPDRLGKLIPIACEFVRIVHGPISIFSRDEEVLLEREIVEYVIEENQQACDELFNAILHHKVVHPFTIFKFVNEHLREMKCKDISPEFSLIFARYIPTVCRNSERSVSRLFKIILPPTPAFHTEKDIVWNRESRYFNGISDSVLRDIFKEMYDDPDDPDRTERMTCYMGMLEFGVFVGILRNAIGAKREPLAAFMVFYMKEARKEDYRRSLEESLSNGPYNSWTTATLYIIRRVLSPDYPSGDPSAAVK